MKKFLITAAIVLSCAITMVPQASAQTANLVFTVPASVQVGQPFNVSITLNFVSGGGIPNLNGFSLWLAQQGGSGAFMITNRNLGASIFTDLQTSNFNLGFPSPPGGGQVMMPINTQAGGSQVNTDLGALSGPPQATGMYFIADFTFVANAIGTFQFSNTTAATPGVGGRISVINDSNGNTFPITGGLGSGPISVVPEPSSIALLCVGLMSAGAVAYRRRSR